MKVFIIARKNGKSTLSVPFAGKNRFLSVIMMQLDNRFETFTNILRMAKVVIRKGSPQQASHIRNLRVPSDFILKTYMEPSKSHRDSSDHHHDHKARDRDLIDIRSPDHVPINPTSALE